MWGQILAKYIYDDMYFHDIYENIIVKPTIKFY